MYKSFVVLHSGDIHGEISARGVKYSTRGDEYGLLVHTVGFPDSFRRYVKKVEGMTKHCIHIKPFVFDPKCIIAEPVSLKICIKDIKELWDRLTEVDAKFEELGRDIFGSQFDQSWKITYRKFTQGTHAMIHIDVLETDVFVMDQTRFIHRTKEIEKYLVTGSEVEMICNYRPRITETYPDEQRVVFEADLHMVSVIIKPPFDPRLKSFRDIVVTKDDVCMICQEIISNPAKRCVTCGQHFHSNCIDTWFDIKEKERNCPHCKVWFVNNCLENFITERIS